MLIVLSYILMSLFGHCPYLNGLNDIHMYISKIIIHGKLGRCKNNCQFLNFKIIYILI